MKKRKKNQHTSSCTEMYPPGPSFSPSSSAECRNILLIFFDTCTSLGSGPPLPLPPPLPPREDILLLLRVLGKTASPAARKGVSNRRMIAAEVGYHVIVLDIEVAC